MLPKPARAKLAKETINTQIPHILKYNDRALTGVNSSKLIHYKPVASSRKYSTAGTTPVFPKISIVKSDTYDAVHAILAKHPHDSRVHVAALNMASSYQPGGGVLNGALAQEEALCLRSTLYPALSTSFYRIPDDAAIHTSDILVFRSADLKDLPRADWFFTDIISCAALKNPELGAVSEEGVQRKVYADEKDKEIMTVKVRLIVQIAKEKGITHLVLGALGCGAYHNPVEEVAKIFRKVILGDRRHTGIVGSGIQEVLFAIFDEGENLRVFKKVFEDVDGVDVGGKEDKTAEGDSDSKEAAEGSAAPAAEKIEE